MNAYVLAWVKEKVWAMLVYEFGKDMNPNTVEQKD